MSSPAANDVHERPRTIRSRAYAFGALLVAALLGLITSAQPWWLVRHSAGESPLTGTITSGGLSQALPAVLLVGWLLALTLAPTGRRILGVLLALVGVAAVVAGVIGAPPADALVQSTVQQATLGGDSTVVRTPWCWAFVAAGLLAVTGAGVMTVRAAGWPTRRQRFDRESDPEELDQEDPAAIWKSLDGGADPTVVGTGAGAVDTPDAAAEERPDSTPISPGDAGGGTMADETHPPPRREPEGRTSHE
ncbi:MAG: Trp biosynthesis-associated membrane protein [Propionibacteriales bacterium]|nr:Trp biosynthesis-associated membrane protein [Propionibacteriales bacterium]